MEELLLKLKKLDVRISVVNENLKLNIPEEVDETLFLDDIRAHKYELIDYIQKKKNAKQYKSIPKSTKERSIKLTPAQGRLFVLQELAKKSIAYNIPFAFEINGVLDVKRLEAALIKLIQRHESLRTSFVLNEAYKPVQEIAKDVNFSLQFDTCTKPELATIVKNFSQPFDLEKAPLLKARLVQIDTNTYILLIDVHHIVFDGLSFQVFLEDLAGIYMGISLPELQIQYKDYAEWYYSAEYQEYLLNQKSFWLQELSGYTNTTILPTDFSRSNEISFEGEQVHFKINKQRKLIIDALKKTNEVSLFSVLLSLFGILQSKLTGVDDLVIGTPVAGRKHDDLKGIIGMFVNTIGIRFNPRQNMGFVHFLKEVSKKTLMCFDHQEYPYEELLEDLDLNKTNAVNPLFNTMITLNNIPKEESKLKDFNIKPYEITKSTSKFDLMIHFNEMEDEYGCSFEYSTNLFKRETIELFFNYLTNIIDQIGENHNILLEDVSLLDKATYSELLEINDFTNVSYPNTMTLVTMFEAQVAKTPENIALQFEGEYMTYKELNIKANKVAYMLKEKGVQRGDIVGLLTGKTFETIIGMLGILKAGGAYLPVDVTYPEKRILYTLESSCAKLLLSLKEFENIIQNDAITFVYIEDADTITNTSNPDPVNVPHDLCYVLYTSGTTGNPKGVMIEHNNVIRLLFNDKFQYDFGEEDVWTMFHSHCFDVSVWEMYGAFLNGGKLIIIPPEIARDPKEYSKILYENGVTVLNQTPTAFYNLSGEAKKQNILLPKIRYVIFAGEALSPTKLKDWHTNQPNAKLINMYGITEVTVHMTYKEIGTYEIENGISNIGRPLHTGSIYILDDNLQPVPKGVIGEIYVGGEGVGRGYLNNETLTNDRFIKNPHKEGDRLYKSGDLAVMLNNGELEYKGRSDHQIQLRGFRIELGEIENQLLKHEAIQNVIVLDKRDKGEEQPYLCAYLVADEQLETEDLRNFLSEFLPIYMIPAYFMQIKKIPYTTNNKVDKTKLPAPKPSELSKYIAPKTPEQEAMVTIWMKVLSATKVGIQDNFFVLGGDSLKAIGLIAEINEILESSLNIADLYTHQTIEKLSSFLKRENNNQHKVYYSQAEETLSNFKKEYEAKGLLKNTYEAVYPMNGVEIGMVFHTLKEKTEQKTIHSIIYHEQNVYPLPSENFNFATFRKALDLMLEKHSVLRKIYDIENLAHVILKEVNPEVNFMDISEFSRAEQETLIAEKKHKEKLKGTQLDMALIWRMTIIKTSNSHHYLLFDFHHSLFGGWSLNSFTTELNNVYFRLNQEEDYKPSLLRSTYRDQILGEIVASLDEENITYWKEELDGYKRLEFASTQLSHEYKMDKYDLGDDFRKELETVASKYGTSFKHLCFAAYVYTMKMFSSTNDVTVGIVANNRPLTPDGDKLLGCFLNTIPFRAIVPENVSWGTYITLIEDKLQKFKRHEKVPFYKILEITDESANDRNPIFDTSFNYMDFHIVNDMVREEAAESIEEGVTGFDNYVNNNTLFDLHITASNNGFKLWLAYSTTIIDKTLSSRIYEYFKAIMYNFVHNENGMINQNDILDKQQKIRIDGFNETTKAFDTEKTLTAWFAEQTVKTPNAIAITYENLEITYAELDAKSNQLARQLQALGATRNTVVGIMQYRSVDMIISIIGILKSGAAYLPIDYSYPKARATTMISDSEMVLLLTDAHTDELFSTTIPKINISKKEHEALDTAKLTLHNTSDDLLYVLYTSGSTGVPKGVMLTHKNLVNLLEYHIHEAKVNTTSVLQFTPLIFDPSFKEIFSALLTGGAIHLLSEEASKDFTAILNKIQEKKVAAIFMPNSVLNQLFNATIYKENLPTTLTNIVSGGEQVIVGDLFKNYLLKHQIYLHNHYGPAETHVVTAHKVSPTEDLPKMPHIGYPIQNTQIHILSEGNHIQPIGIPGELYIGGTQVGLGYLNRLELTEERFIPNPYGEGKLYKTGDLGYWNTDGSITFLGRKDFQVKINGVRIELGEIERHLNDISGISDSVVLLQEIAGNKTLVGYYLSVEKIPETTLKNYLAEHLPINMVPNHYIHMEDFPKTATGKLHLKSFPLPGISEKHIAPKTITEERLLVIWAEILERDIASISIRSGFFDLGGNSLKAIVMINMLNKKFLIKILLKSIFEYQNIETLANYIDNFKEENIDIFNFSKITPTTNSIHPKTSFEQRKEYMRFRIYGDLDFKLTLTIPILNLNEEAMTKAIAALLDRHEILRTTFFFEDGIAKQKIHPSLELSKVFENIVLKKGETIESRLHTEMKDTSEKKFNFEEGPLISIKMGVISEEYQGILIAMHHVITDERSMEVIERDLLQLYNHILENKDVSQIPAIDIQYKDYSNWVNNFREKNDAISEKFYADKVKESLALNGKSYDEIIQKESNQYVATLQKQVKKHAKLNEKEHKEFPEIYGYVYDLLIEDKGGVYQFIIDAKRMKKIEKLRSMYGTSAFFVIVAIFSLVMAEMKSEKSIRMLIPFSTRVSEKLSDVIGWLASAVLSVVSLEDELDMKKFVSNVTDTILEASNHRFYNFEKIMSNLNLNLDIIAPIHLNYFQLDEAYDGVMESRHIERDAGFWFNYSSVIVHYTDCIVFNTDYKYDYFSQDEIEEFFTKFIDKIDDLIPNTEIFEEGSTVAEEKTTKIWAEVLATDASSISIHHNFFELGGNSLKAMMMINMLNRAFSVNIFLKSIFKYPTVASLAAYIETLDTKDFIAIPKTLKEAHYPLSSAQQRMYFLYEFDKQGTTYNMPGVFEINGTLDIVHLKAVFQQLLERHQTLHTQFKMHNGKPVQTVLEEYEFEIPVVKFEEDIPKHVKDFIRPFDITNELPIRVELLEMNTETHILLIDMHHIISDGVSLEILMHDFWKLYQKEVLEPLSIQYVDYATWQQSDTFDELIQSQKTYWLNAFSEKVTNIELPTDYARPVYVSNEGISHNVQLSTKQSNALLELARSQGVTLYTLLLTVYNIFINKLSAQNDIVIGTATAGRHHANLAGLVGMFVNTLPLRNKLEANLSFNTFLKAVHENTLEAFDHQLYQYEDLVEALEIERNTSRNPLFDVFFLFNEILNVDSFKDETITVKPYESFVTKSKFDFSLEISTADDLIKIGLNARKDLFKQTTLQRFVTYLLQIITQVLDDPTQKISDIEILSAQEKTTLLETFNETDTTYNTKLTVVDMFKAQVDKTPEAIALVMETAQLTYSELDHTSDQWATNLVSKGISKGDVVALVMNRSTEMITAILSVLKSGATYVPINPNEPSKRTHHIFEESKVQFVISTIDTIPEDLAQTYTWIRPEELEVNTTTINLQLPSPDDIAYILYTSGSTGLPKGVIIQHKNVANFICHEKAFLNINESDRVLQFSPYYFDVSVQQIWMTLTAGAQLVLVKEELLAQPEDFVAYLDTQKITILNTTPSYLEGLRLPKMESLEKIVVSGEECKPQLAAKYIDDYEFYNEYGPTEATVIAIACKITAAMTQRERLPIGTPIANVKAYILDDQLHALPKGSIGHLYVSGAGISLGYLNRPELTKESFLTNPYGTASLYKTGDLAKWNDDGTIEYLGRADQQIKLNGVRIEPGEIENQLCNLDAISDCVVTLKDQRDEKVLVAYYTTNRTIEETEVKTYLLDKLPMNMIPRYYIELTSFPITASGKLDRKALPELEEETIEYVAPSNETEEKLTSIWAELLQIEPDTISIHDTFFNLGGNSLKAIMLSNRILQEFTVEMSLKEMFLKQTVKAIADYIIVVKQLKGTDTNNEGEIKLII